MTVESTSPTPGPDPEAINAARAEYARLKVKVAESKDKDVRGALELRMAQIREEFGVEVEAKKPAAKAPAVKLPERTDPPTDAEAREADALIARARLEIQRGNVDAGRKLIDQAVEIAPGSPAVVETLGDYYFERNDYGSAKACYERAKTLDPKSKQIEGKFATAVLQEFNAGTIDDQLRLGLSDNIFMNPDDARAGSMSIVVLSIILPGLGHVVAGKTSTGAGIIASWVVCFGWLTLMRKDLADLLLFARGGGSSANLLVLVPLFLMIVIFIGTLKSVGVERETAARKPIDHPRPPVDLPFE